MSEQTAYALSVAAAQKLMQSVQKEQTEIEWLEEKKAQHKKAFRLAFDFLEKMWPPENTLDYWTMVCAQTALLYSESSENKLCKLFLLAIMDYLEKVGKEREDRTNGQEP